MARKRGPRVTSAYLILLVVSGLPGLVLLGADRSDGALRTVGILYSVLLFCALALEVSALVALGVLALFRRPVFAGDKRLKAEPEERFQRNFARPVFLVAALLSGGAGIAWAYGLGTSLAVPLILCILALLVFALLQGLFRLDRRPRAELRWRVRLHADEHRDWRVVHPADRRAALTGLERLQVAASRLHDVLTTRGFRAESRGRGPWVLALALLIATGAGGLALYGVVRHVREPGWTGWRSLLVTVSVVVALLPVVLWSWNRVERWFRQAALRDLATTAARVRLLIRGFPLARTLVLTTNVVERDAVLDAVHQANGVRHGVRSDGITTVFVLGALSAVEVVLAQTVQRGGTGPGGATLTAAELIDRERPNHVILVGVCDGLDDADQKLGDIVVADQVLDLDPVLALDGRAVQVGENVAPSVVLMDRFEVATVNWAGPTVHRGQLLSSSIRLRSAAARRDLRHEAPLARGIEAEGAGVYAAATRNKVDWIVVKGIAGWGDREPENLGMAVRAAAEFLVRVLSSGLLDDTLPRPARYPGGTGQQP